MSEKNKIIELFQFCLNFQKQVMGKPSSRRLYFSQIPFTKQNLLTYSILTLVIPTNRPDILGGDGKIYDFSSSFILLRSMYENLVNHFFVLRYYEDNLSDLIIGVILLHASKERNILLQGMKSSYPEKKKESYEEMVKLKDNILKNENYNKLPSDIVQFVENVENLNKNVNWNKVKFEDKSLIAGFHSSQHKNINKFFSNHVHSDGLSLQQIGAVKKSEDAEKMCESIFDYLENFLGQSLRLHHEICSEMNIQISLPGYILEIIDTWQDINSMDLLEDF